MTKPDRPQPEPVVKAGTVGSTIAAVVSAGGMVFVFFGLTSSARVAQFTQLTAVFVTAAVTAIVFLAPYVAALRARNKVTPITLKATPRDAHGRQLVPAAAYGAHAAPITVDELLHRLDQQHAEPVDELAAWAHALNHPDTQETIRMTALSHTRRPRTVSTSYTGRQVAQAYGLDPKWTGKGFTGGLVELGGGFGKSDLTAYFGRLGIPTPSVVAVAVAGGKNTSDGPDGADGEVLLDIEVAAAVAPGASYRVYFAPNTDDGFLAAIEQAIKECDAVSISWGGPENAWDPNTMDMFDQALAAGRKAGVPVFAAAGDTGSGDSGGRGNHVDFPASSPNVVGCGGTRLTLNADGTRAAEVVWDDNDTSSATGGGVSTHFPGRDVPDVAGNADPQTGYEVIVDGEQLVIGGTSAVAPLYLGMFLALLEATGGHRFDFLNTVATNPQVCFDVVQGDNGGFRAGPGRDQTTGYGVVDAGKLLAVLVDPIPDPVPPSPQPTPAPTVLELPDDILAWARKVAAERWQPQYASNAAKHLLKLAGQPVSS